jgi:AcrR family transcriptional regulator
MRKPSVQKGRPREFNADKALSCALTVFQRKGYEGASLPDLTRAMGINRPSLYAAFGNKESLFRKALDRYSDSRAACFRQALSAPTVRASIEQLLRGIVGALTDPKSPPGCLIVHGALACGKESDPIRKELISRRLAGETAIRRRLQRAKSEGDLPKNANPADLARYFATVLHGLSVQAASGAKRADLLKVVQTALRAFPAQQNGER